MAVTRIVANLVSARPARTAAFYGRVFGLDLPLDMGWIAFLQAGADQQVELHLAQEGGSGTDLPAISIGVDDLDATLERARAAGADIPYGPVTEPWGVRRFYLRDPDGNLVNVVHHQ